MLDKNKTKKQLIDELASSRLRIKKLEKSESKRKQAEEELKESQDIINKSPCVVFLWKNAEGWPVEFVSENVKDLLGYSANDLLTGKVLYEKVVHPDDLEMVAKKVDPYNKQKTRKYFSLIYRVVTKDKKLKWIDERTFIRRDDEGKITHYQGIVWDITEKKKAEEKIKSSENFLNNIIEQSPTSLWISDSNGTLIKMNQACRELMGATEEEAVGKYNLFKDNLIKEQGFMPLIENVFEKGDIARFTIDYALPSVEHVKVKGATHRILDVIVSPIKDTHGKVTNAIVQHKNITERKLAEEAVQKSNSLLSSIIESPDNVIMFALDVNYNYLSFNKAHVNEMKQVYDVDIEVGHPILEYLSNEEDRLKAETNYKRVLKGERFIETQEYGQAESRFWYELVFNPIYDDSNNVMGFTVFVTNITERRKTEEDLKKSEKRFKDVALTSADWIWEVDKEGKYTFASGKVKSVLGYSPEELIGKTPFDFMSKAEAKNIGGIFKQIVSEKELIVDLENWNLRKDGKKVCLLTNGMPMLDEKGDLIGYRGIDKDITERKKAEEALKSSEERLKILFEYAPDAYYLNDLKGNFIDGNLAAEDLLGYKRGDLIGKSFIKLKLLSAKEIAKAARLLAKNILGKGTGPDEFTLHLKDGNTVITEIRTYPVKIKEQTLVLGIARDMTERKQAEEALRENEGKMRIMFESIADGIIITDLDANIIEVNKSVLRMGKYNHKEALVGRNAIDFVSPKDRVKAMENLNKEIELGESIEDLEYSLLTADGGEFDVESRATIMRDNSGNPVALINVIRDITDRKKAEKKIKASLKEKDVLLKEIHHRVKNNMQIIVSLLRLQSHHAKDKKIEDMLKVAQNRVRSMAIIHEKLYMSKDFAEVNFSHYIQSLTTHLIQTYQIDPEQINFIADVKDVYLDINQGVPVGLLLNELVSNALKHAFPKGKKGEIIVKFYTDKKGKKTLIVKDNGIGHPDKVDVSKPETLGMQLINDLTKQIGGKLSLDNKDGTTVKITFS